MSDLKSVKAKDTLPINPAFFEEIGHTSVTWLGSAGFIINSRGSILLLDPVITTKPDQKLISETGLKLYENYPINALNVPKADAVLYTHPDNDHLGELTAPILSRLKPRFMGPVSVMNKLNTLGVYPQEAYTVHAGDSFIWKNITVSITPADHPWQLLDPKRYGRPFGKEDCCGYIITTPDIRAYFPGDTRLMEEHLLIQDIDLLGLDVSTDLYHLGEQGAIILANSLPEALLVPMHYGTYDVADMAAQCGNPDIILGKVENGIERARILAPGEVINFRNRKEFRI